MAWRSDEDFFTFLSEQSELSELGYAGDSGPKPPTTVRRYYETIEHNKKASVLHTEEEPEEVTYCISGRGRGGKRAYMTPGGHISRTLYGRDAITASNDISEELRKSIRATSGINYSNGYIQDLIRAKQAENEEKRESNAENPTVELIEVSPTRSKGSSPRRKMHETVDLANADTVFEHNGQAASSSLSSVDVVSAESRNCSVNDLLENVNKQLKLDENRNVESSKGAIPKKPIPLSELLKKNKDKQKLKIKEKEETNTLSPLATPFYPRSVSTTDGASSDSSSSSEYLSWRHRTASPQFKYNWGNIKSLNIRSNEDFPVLKKV